MHRNLWAPWRMSYLRQLAEERDALGVDGAASGDDDFLAAIWAHPELDESNHVVHRDGDGMILLNRYPYANGHLLIALGDAAPRLLDYPPGARAKFWALVDRAAAICHQALHPQGINIGINEGRAAGAGVPAHLHAHVVPRWGGDTNFLSVVGEVRVIPDSLGQMARQYREAARVLA